MNFHTATLEASFYSVVVMLHHIINSVHMTTFVADHVRILSLRSTAPIEFENLVTAEKRAVGLCTV